jgi:cell wall-associated NlpC family hydrolase
MLAAGLFAAAVVVAATGTGVSGAAALGQGSPEPRPAGSAGIAATAIAYAEAQIGKPYRWGGCGPTDACAAFGDHPTDGFDCSGLMYMAYRAAGISIARTSGAQWATEVKIPAGQEEPGDLVFFAGSDGTVTDPGHVGLVTGDGKMIEAYATGFPIRVSSYQNRGAIGFTRPLAASSGGKGAGR